MIYRSRDCDAPHAPDEAAAYFIRGAVRAFRRTRRIVYTSLCSLVYIRRFIDIYVQRSLTALPVILATTIALIWPRCCRKILSWYKARRSLRGWRISRWGMDCPLATITTSIYLSLSLSILPLSFSCFNQDRPLLPLRLSVFFGKLKFHLYDKFIRGFYWLSYRRIVSHQWLRRIVTLLRWRRRVARSHRVHVPEGPDSCCSV